jgi:hypothetical protein
MISRSHVILQILLILITQPVWACSVCFKDPDSQLTVGLQQAVIVLLGFLFIVFCAFLKFIFNFIRRSKASSNQLTP